MSNQFYNWFDWRSMTAATGMHIIFRQTKGSHGNVTALLLIYCKSVGALIGRPQMKAQMRYQIQLYKNHKITATEL